MGWSGAEFSWQTGQATSSAAGLRVAAGLWAAAGGGGLRVAGGC